MNDNKKKISHLKNIDSKLADHILDEIIERYMYLALSVHISVVLLIKIFCTAKGVMGYQLKVLDS